MLHARGCDQHGINVDPNHLVAELGKVTAVASWAAACIEKPRTAWRKSIDEARLTVQVLTSSGHLVETLDVPP